MRCTFGAVDVYGGLVGVCLFRTGSGCAGGRGITGGADFGEIAFEKIPANCLRACSWVSLISTNVVLE